MSGQDRFDGNSAEVSFSEPAYETLAELDRADAIDVLARTLLLLGNPAGKHRLSGDLRGWRTQEAVRRTQRIIFRVNTGDNTLDVVFVGPRDNDEVYKHVARLLRQRGDDLGWENFWQIIAVLEIAADELGVEPLDPFTPADEHYVNALVKGGLIPADWAGLLTKDEVERAVIEYGNTQDADIAVNQALGGERTARAVQGSRGAARRRDRCGKWMPRAKRTCERKQGHDDGCQ